jgi:hypothetical protein
VRSAAWSGAASALDQTWPRRRGRKLKVGLQRLAMIG